MSRASKMPFEMEGLPVYDTNHECVCVWRELIPIQSGVKLSIRWCFTLATAYF